MVERPASCSRPYTGRPRSHLPDHKRRGDSEVKFEPPASPDLTVVLTAFNDELSIAQSVLDFKSHPRVRRVIVLDNNSSDETRSRAAAAGAIVVCHRRPGYVECVHRALTEGLAGCGPQPPLRLR